MYSLTKAAKYWGKRISTTADEIEAVAALTRPAYINNAYTRWELDTVENILDKRNPHTLVDLACGVGRFTVPLAEKIYIKEVKAIDVTQEMIDRCQTHILNANLGTKVDFFCVDSTHIPLTSNSADAVICLGLFEHLCLEYQLKTLSEIKRILKKGGVLILEINNAKSYFLKDEEQNFYRRSSQLENGYFCGLVDKNKISDALAKENLKIEQTFTNPFFSLVAHILCQLKDPGFMDKEELINMAQFLDSLPPVEAIEQIHDQFIFEIEKC